MVKEERPKGKKGANRDRPRVSTTIDASILKQMKNLNIPLSEALEVGAQQLLGSEGYEIKLEGEKKKLELKMKQLEVEIDEIQKQMLEINKQLMAFYSIKEENKGNIHAEADRLINIWQRDGFLEPNVIQTVARGLNISPYEFKQVITQRNPEVQL